MSTQIAYVGKRESYRDGLFGTGQWLRGETKWVDDAVAMRMLRHADQYARGAEEGNGEGDGDGDGDGNGAAEVVGRRLPAAGAEDDAANGLRDLIAAMGKEALSDYARVNFSMDIDKRLGVEKLRAQVLGLVDEYGVD